MYTFAFKFTLRSQQPDIVPIICHRYVDTSGKFATSINNTSKTGDKICRRCRWYRWQICHQCRWYRWCTLTCEYLREFSNKFEAVLLGYSRAGGKLIHEKNQKQYISWHCPFNCLFLVVSNSYFIFFSRSRQVFPATFTLNSWLFQIMIFTMKSYTV